ncbi:MAG: hypothetical protein II820_11255 [Ruminiclostridium sp.]|nr:hypothetical protein [Ruminiclostridium sp.]
MKYDMKKALTTAIIAALMLGAVSCAPQNAPAGTTAPAASENNTEAAGTTAAAETSEAQTEAASGEIDPKTADYSKIDVTIPFDSGEQIVNFTNDMLAGKYDGKIVKCEGIAQRRMTGNAMMQKQEDGSSRGFTWILVDAADKNDYPPEDSHVEITGVVGIGEYDVRYLYVLPENVKIMDGDDSAGSEEGSDEDSDYELQTGVWWATSDYDPDSYYTFRDDGSGNIIFQDIGSGVPFGYTRDGAEYTFEIAAAGNFSKMTVISHDNDIAEIKWEDGRVEHLVYQGSADSFKFYSNMELGDMAKAYYAGNHDGYVPAVVDSEIDENGMIVIHLYDVVDDHTATGDWYTVDRFTGKGTDVLGNEVDLVMAAGSESDMNGSADPEDMTGSFAPQKKILNEEGYLFGVRYLGYIDASANDPGIDGLYINNILESTGTAEECNIYIGMPGNHFASTKDGTELYLIVPRDVEGKVTIYENVIDYDTAKESLGNVIYKGENAEPLLLKCNVSDIFPDVVVEITDKDGKSFQWRPFISGENGQVVTNNAENVKIYDFTDYSRLAGPELVPVG